MTNDEIPLTTAGHQAAHILLDAIAAWDPQDPNDFSAPNSHVPRLQEVGAVSVEGTSIDISGLLQGASTTLVMLIAAVAAQNNTSMDNVIASLRKQIDGLPRE